MSRLIVFQGVLVDNERVKINYIHTCCFITKQKSCYFTFFKKYNSGNQVNLTPALLLFQMSISKAQISLKL